jgi:G3E family GTPase
VRQDLIAVLAKLCKRVQSGKLHLDGIIIETTGMADPAPVAQTFFVDDLVKSFARLDGIVTLVDAKHIEQHLDEEKPEGAENEAVEQVAFADRILLNKVDLVEEEDLVRVETRLKSMNSAASIQRCTKANVAVDWVLDIGAFDLKRTLEMDPGEHPNAIPAAACDSAIPTRPLCQLHAQLPWCTASGAYCHGAAGVARTLSAAVCCPLRACACGVIRVPQHGR